MKIESFRDLRVLVTGASSGIGRAFALRLAGQGARLALVARRRDELDALAGEIDTRGGEALVLPCDVAERDQVEACAARAEQMLGGVDLLVNNAGYGHHRAFLDWDVADMERMLRVNYLGSLYFTRSLAPGMRARGCGWIVFVASVAGRIASPEESAYVASKFAMVGLAESLSIELEQHGIHVLTVCPGVVDTPFFDAEAMERMPPVARRSMVEVDGMVDAMVRALRKGRHGITFPRRIAAGYIVRALAPSFFRRQVKRATLEALAREAAVGK
jgi:hypothetical protein